MATEWPYREHAAALRTLQRLEDNMNAMDVIACLECMRNLSEVVPAMVMAVLEIGADTYSQRRMADALGVPPSMLRGLKAEVSERNRREAEYHAGV